VIAADLFYAPEPGGLQQGDILLSGVSRTTASDGYSPPQWDQLDAQQVVLDGAKPGHEPLRLFSGFGLVMVTSHDCQLEKEWNRRRSELVALGHSEDDAEAAATADDSLDRSVVASPLIDPDDLTTVDRGNLLGGRIVGYLPVPASVDGHVPESVVDLTYRCTVDRLDVVRVASLTTLARSQLRYALVRLDALRTPYLGFEVESVIGRRIEGATVPKKDPLTVRLRLDDGRVIELMQQPGEPPGPSARTSVRS
jgi:hypothetical protein